MGIWQDVKNREVEIDASVSGIFCIAVFILTKVPRNARFLPMSKRVQRVSMEVQRALSDIFLRGVPDRRVGMISIIAVDCSPDLRWADVQFVPLAGKGDVSEIQAGLEHVSGFINKELAKRVKLKYSPRVRFHFDDQFFDNVDFIDKLEQMESDSEGDSEDNSDDNSDDSAE